jgi:hypothetical protein
MGEPIHRLFATDTSEALDGIEYWLSMHVKHVKETLTDMCLQRMASKLM